MPRRPGVGLGVTRPTARRQFQIRASTPEDFEALYAIDQLCFESGIAYSRRELRIYLRLPGAECLVAEAAGKPIGFIVIVHDAASAYIITLDVLPEYRRQGVAASLLETAEKGLTARDVGQVSLETATDNAAAIAFWQKHGYRTYGIIENYYPGGRSAYSMTKSIANRPSRKRRT
jgi:[ribosomal protein S18]-alanine N-acetyltransferase